MLLLLLASTIWAFSFGLIGNRLAGLDTSVIALFRLGLSALAFLPFALRGQSPGRGVIAKLLPVGALQFGCMYLFYIGSFRYLESHTVALFTVFTPIYVSLLAGKPGSRSYLRPLLGAALAVIGAAVINWQPIHAKKLWQGFALVQASNLCFAVGQLLYRRLMRDHPGVSDISAMPWMYLGAAAACAPFAAYAGFAGGFSPSGSQLAVLMYLGVVATGLGFWIWNAGARSVSRAGTLAVMNNAKIPLGILVSLLVFGETRDPRRLLPACAIMLLAVAVSEWRGSRKAGPRAATLCAVDTQRYIHNENIPKTE